jgi:hypothetical protein
MTDDPSAFNKNYHRQVEREIAEADEPRNRQQAQLDMWWQSQRDLEFAEDDAYEVGGFLEFRSRTPSFHKSKRDRDWRVK